MFLAKFQQVNSDKFESDKNGNMPFIGEVIAGKATGTIYNGTMFAREGLEPNKVYMCDNHIDEAYPKNVQTRIISVVSLLELAELSTQLGKANLNVDASTPE
tara:strand:+ start:1054 stop:1359 length:306 start_codon:yes stop_codon:yes gene_type:complete